MRNLIVGAGEVGKSLYEVLKDHHETFIRDKENLLVSDVEVLNICFPYFKGFEKFVRGYERQYNPKVTIIHSTVKPGTTRKLKAVHSPIHGKHPNLAGGIKTFVKYVGGEDTDKVATAAFFLNSAGITTRIVFSSIESELSKILCTTYYGWNIMFNKWAKSICDKYEADFDQVYGWNKFYNAGYKELGMEQFTRPVLDYVPGKIGGHCVIPNAKLLDSWLTRLMVKKDATIY